MNVIQSDPRTMHEPNPRVDSRAEWRDECWRANERCRAIPIAASAALRKTPTTYFERLNTAPPSYTMSGSNVQYFNPYSGRGRIVFSTTPFPTTSSVQYADSYSDIGLTLSLGVGLDVRMIRSLSGRALIDYDPTFLTRPDIHNEGVPEATGSTHVQNHIRLTAGVVWHPR